MRPGITLQHSREVSRRVELVRSDITGFIGVIPPRLWPEGASRGDYYEMKLESLDALTNSAAAQLFDKVTVRAVEHFFQNGGEACVLFGLCIRSESDLVSRDPYSSVWGPMLYRLQGAEDIGILAMPVLSYLKIEYDERGRVTVPADASYEALLKHCRQMNNRFLIIDAPRELHDEALVDWVEQLRDAAEDAASYGALYYPWLNNGDDTFPPSGCVAGAYARLERERAPFGIRWPPANIQLHHVTHPAVPVKWAETEDLVNAHINPILTQPTRGVVIWGARTLSRDPRWMHINARRVISFITEQVRQDSEWVVFENLRPELYEILHRQVTNRLDELWGAGLLAGDKAGLEYLVQCDQELNPVEVRDSGQVHVRVTLRPVATAEFVVVDLRLGE